VKAVADVIELSMADHSMAANAMSKAERSFDVVAQRLDELARLEQSLSVNAYAVAESEFATLKPRCRCWCLYLSPYRCWCRCVTCAA
jgi:methyl-accepting chemotaxis protein